MALDPRLSLLATGADPNAAMAGFGQGFAVAKSLRDIARQDKVDVMDNIAAQQEAAKAERQMDIEERSLGVQEKRIAADQQATEQQNIKAAVSYIGNIAQNAKTPQEWDAGVQSLADAGIIKPEVAQKYVGQFGQRGAVLSWVQNQMGQFKDLPTSAQEFQMAQKDPAYGQFLREKQSAGRTSVTIDQKTEGAFDKAVAEKDATRFNEISTASANANRMLGNIDQMQSLLATTPQGQIVDLVRPLAQIADEMGIDVGDALGKSGAEAITAIVQRIAPTMRAPGSGSTSDIEFKGFLASLPKLSNTPGGNQLILDGLRAFALRSIEEAAIADEALAGNISREEARKRIRELGPVLPKQKPTEGGKEPTRPNDVPEDLWSVMTPEEKALWK